jgi:hypothetical protein
MRPGENRLLAEADLLPRGTLFEDLQRRMIAWNETIKLEETIAQSQGEETGLREKVRQSELLSGWWRDRWLKLPPKRKTELRTKVRKRMHSSMHRILEADQQRHKREKK